MSTTTTTTSSSATCRTGRSRRVRTRIRTGDGASLSVSDWRAPLPDRTVVFLHGLCLSQDAWAIQRRHVLRHFGHHTRVISYDHRGHGDSGAAPTSTYRIAQLARDLDDVLEALNVRGPLVLVGHSMGAMAALNYMARGARTAEVAGLVLCATAAGGLAEHGLGRLLRLPVFEPLLAVLDRCSPKTSRALVAPVRLALRRAHSGAVTQMAASALENNPLRTAAGFLASIRDMDLAHTLGSISAPTTVLSGGSDPLIPSALSRALAAAIPDATHVHLPHAGHMLPQLESRTVNAAVAAAVAGAVNGAVA